MKKAPKIIISAVLIFVFVFLLLSVVALLYSKRLLISGIERSLNLKTNLKAIDFSLPSTLILRNLEIEEFFSAETVSLSPSILGFLAGKVILNGVFLDNPAFTLTRNADGTLWLPLTEAVGTPPGKKGPAAIPLKIRIRDGEFVFLDKKVDPTGHRFNIRNIDVDAAKQAFPPQSLRVDFKISADIPDAAGRPTGKLKASGWVDYGPKNMDGNIQIRNMDLTNFLPYFQGTVFSRKVLSAKLNLDAQPRAKNNDLAIICRMEIDNIVYDTQEQGAVDVVGKAMDIFSDDTGKMVFTFTLRTKLDKPFIDSKALKGIFFRSAVDNIVSQDPDKLYDKVKKTAKEFEDFGKTFKDIFKKE